MQKAQETMKLTANKKRREVQFHVGDMVMVRLRPRRQVTITGQHQRSPKLNKRYYGPFPVLEKIGPDAYKLKLPKDARIHPVFHCFMLKPFHSPVLANTSPTLALPSLIVDNEPVISPKSIVGTRYTSDSETPKLQVLVQWEGLLPKDTTWEDWEQLQPNYHLEGKVILEGPGDDRNREDASIRPKRKSSAPSYLKDYI